MSTRLLFNLLGCIQQSCQVIMVGEPWVVASYRRREVQLEAQASIDGRFESLGYCGLYRRVREVLGLLVQVSQAVKVTFPRAQELPALSRNPERFFSILYHRSLFNRNRQVVDRINLSPSQFIIITHEHAMRP
ncbi:hypothetical protein WG66_011171 [Moniliophthora roreri]|nr:hypothetical protein WG66_011171 [Moniliophthora roreri]